MAAIRIQLSAELVREHQAAIWRHLRMLGCSGNEAEDLLQETFLALMRAPLEDRGPAALRAWLKATARNLLFAERRRSGRSPTTALELDAAIDDYERDDTGTAYRTALQHCLENLLPRHRHLLELQLQRTAPEELARAAGLAPEGARSLLRRIKCELRHCVTRRLAHET